MFEDGEGVAKYISDQNTDGQLFGNMHSLNKNLKSPMGKGRTPNFNTPVTNTATGSLVLCFRQIFNL